MLAGVVLMPEGRCTRRVDVATKRAVTPPMLRWIDLAVTGAIRRPLYEAAMTHLRTVGHPDGIDERGAELLGVPEAWPVIRDAGDPPVALNALIRRVVEARLQGAWWDTAAEALAEMQTVGPGAGTAWTAATSVPQTDAWDAFVRTVVGFADVGREDPRGYVLPGWVVDTAVSTLPGFGPAFGLWVSRLGGQCARVVRPELLAIRHSAATLARGRGGRGSALPRALLLDADRRAAVVSAFTVGGAPPGAQALAACLR